MKILYGEDLVKELRNSCDRIKERLWIAVPYIGGLESVRRIIGRQWIENPKLSIRLLTDTNEINNFNSETIKLFFEVGKMKNLAGLHAKIFITDNTCLLTSANLTNTAFTKRHEIGIFLDIPHSIKTISIFESWWKKSKLISLNEIRPLITRKLKSAEERTGSTLPILWKLPEEPDEATYWLKPIGVTDEPITEERIFNQATDYLHFGTPSKTPQVKVGDILIGYGVGAKRILSIYQATSKPLRVTKKVIAAKPRLKRWPWYVVGKNLTPNFGGSWQQHNLFASDLVNKFLEINPNKFITTRKKKHLHALMRGKDRIKLEPEFARFIIEQVTKINDKI